MPEREILPEILFERCGGLGLVTLSRPNAMNALTHGMALALEAQLDAWADDGSVAVVAIRGAGDRAFAAGGDIRALYDAGRPDGPGDGRRNFRFFADEYRLNAKIKRYAKPYVGLMDGVVMGGGVGISVHGSRRVAGDRTVFAMPETGIGLFPDVGATWFLPRLPGQTGMWLGLTGARLKTADAVACGVCDLHVASGAMGDLIDGLSRIEPGAREPLHAVDDVLAALRVTPEGVTVLDRHAERIDRCFAGDSVEAVLAALEAEGDDWSAAQRAAILTKSPSSTRIAFRQIREGARLDFEDCMRLEYRLARYCMTHHDFYEGVRAVIVDKDNRPHWQPATLAEATDAFIAEAFAPLGADELRL